MTAFFYGRRRKFGVVTLMLACVLTAAWVRSQKEFDCFAFTDNPWIHISLQSAGGTLSLSRDSLNSPQLAFWWSGDLSRPEPTDPMEGCEGCNIEWRWDWGGFNAVSFFVNDGTEIIRTGLFSFPYWSIVVPLTLFSAYLLLCKPRQTAPKKANEPAPADGA